MKNTKPHIFFGITMGVFFVLTLFIFWPFIVVLVLAAVMAVILSPINSRFTKWFFGSRIAGALITVILLLIVIILPLTLIGDQLINEAQGLYAQISVGDTLSFNYVNEVIQTQVSKVWPSVDIRIQDYLMMASNWIAQNFGAIFTGTLDFAIKFFLGIIALFFFLKDGKLFESILKSLSPMSNEIDDYVSVSIKKSIKSVVLGSLIVAIVQGFLAGLGFAMFGVPSFTLWGTAAGLASLIPGVGTAIVWIPAVVYLIIKGKMVMWIALLLWSVFVVGLVDNIIRPIIIEKAINIHPLLILFSILGGVSFFGPEGFILGPLVLSVLFALVRIYKSDEFDERISKHHTIV